MKESLQGKLLHYSNAAKAVKKQVKSGTPVGISLGAALLAVNPVAEGAIVYSGPQNLSVTWVDGGNTNVSIDINGGGNDLRFFGYDFGGNGALNLRDTGLGAVNAVNGNTSGGYQLPFANSSGELINSADLWNGSNAQSMANVAYGSLHWNADDIGTGTRFLGIRLTDGGCTKYGWVRVTRNAERSWTIVDWAYNDDCGAAITTGQALPVELLSFTAKVAGTSTNLSWQTATEDNNAGFELQRSTDKQNYRNISFIEGKGTTYQEQEYAYDDRDLRRGQTYYYRLKQIDFDGQFTYSEVITAKIEEIRNTIGLAPNPVSNGETVLSYSSENDGQLSVSIFDATGKELLSQEHTVLKGQNQIRLSTSTLSTGMYFVKTKQGSVKNYERLIVQ